MSKTKHDENLLYPGRFREQKQDETFLSQMEKIYTPQARVEINPENPNEVTDLLVARQVTFQVTDACNLCCSYCYQINKGHRSMPFDTAKLLVDKLISGEDGITGYLKNPWALALEFIGGEPFLEVDLIDRVIDYFREQTIKLNHPWAERFRVSLCSNGVLYRDKKVQDFLRKHKDVVSLAITVDGTKQLHDACRVFPDGKGSYDLAHDAAMDWMKRGNNLGSKITLSPNNIEYYAECMKQMVKDGYWSIYSNCVFEDVWRPEDATTIYWQAKEFIDWFFAEGYDNQDFFMSYFMDNIGAPMPEEQNNNWCGGTGNMLAMDPDGKLYPCLRYMESSLGTGVKPPIIGDVWRGIGKLQCERDCLKCMDVVTRRSQSTDECFYCPIASGCAWCSGYNYQTFGTFNKRTIFLCEMQKSRVLSTAYYWNSYYKKYPELEKHFDLYVPRDWAVPIVGEEEYEMLVELTKSVGGYVNEDQYMIKDYHGDKVNTIKCIE